MTRAAPWLLVAGVALLYVVVALVTGGPTFPSRDDCVRPATAGGEIDAVFGYLDSEAAAAELRDRALAVGFQGTEAAWNGCGRVRVAVAGIPSLAVGQEFVEQARGAGFDVTLEQSP